MIVDSRGRLPASARVLTDEEQTALRALLGKVLGLSDSEEKAPGLSDSEETE